MISARFTYGHDGEKTGYSFLADKGEMVHRDTSPTHKRRIGLIGGTFDPIHHAHLIIAEEVRYALGLAEMVFIPAGNPPHKAGNGSTAVAHRLAMVELAIASNPHFTLSHVEANRLGPSYLVDTLRILHQQWGADVELSFVIGWDSLQDLAAWYDPVGILSQLTHLIAVRRPGYIEDEQLDKAFEARVPGLGERLLVVESAPLLDISSTDLRRRVAEGRPITYQTPETVERYILEHGLYHIHTPETES